MQHLILYSSSLFLFLIAITVLFICNLKNWQPHYLNFLSACYILTMLSLTVDILWSFVDGNPDLIWLNHIFTIVECICFSFAGYCWLMRCDCQCGWNLFTRSGKWLLVLPALAVTALMAASVRTGWAYTIDANAHYQRGPLIIIRQTGCIYLIAASVIALVKRSQTDLPIQKRHYAIISTFCLPPTILGTIQLLVPPAFMPTTQFSMFLSLFILYVDEQNGKITRDSLTQLRNRSEFERVVKDRMSRHQSDTPPYLYILGGDLDRFKSINDTYGHLVGDQALQLTADTLSCLALRYDDAIVARISGDEFSVVMEADSDEVPEAFCLDADEALEAACQDVPYRLSISLGVARYDGKMSLIELLSLADRRMYEKKRLLGKNFRI